MKKWDGLVGRMLSGVAGKIVGSRQKAVGRKNVALSLVVTIGLMLGFFASQAIAFTDVYTVKPTSASNSDKANAVWETFRATCDSIDSVTFFVGSESLDTTAYFTVQIRDTATDQQVWSDTKSARGWKYQDIGFGVHKPVTRGRTYKLVITITGDNQQMWNYFYDNSNPYLWGNLGTAIFGVMGGKDLAARVIGRNRIPQTLWGVNAYIGNTCDWVPPASRDLIMAKLDTAGIKLNREQIPWYKVQGEYSGPDSFSWDSTDHAVAATARRDMPLLFNHFGFTPRWASSWDSVSYDTNSTKWHSAPPRNLDADTAGGTNYFYNYMKKLARRYGPNGVFWDSTALGDSLRDEGHYQPVRDWEINNEVNLTEFWDFWWQGHYYPGYTNDSTGRAKLYLQACKVAWDAIKTSGIDPQARIYTNAVTNLRESGGCPSGKGWLRIFYDQANQQGGQTYTDVLAYHFYSSKYIHWFYPSTFEADYDTVREIMKEKGDTLRPVWSDEGGWGSSTKDHNNPNWVSREKQADIVVQLYNTGIGQLTNPRGPLANISWFSGFDWKSAGQDSPAGLASGVLEHPTSGVAYKPSGWACKQMTGKLKNLYFNQRVLRPDPLVRCYEFQIPGPDTTLRTWCLWRDTLAKAETLSIRTNVAWLVTRDITNTHDSILVYPIQDGSGKVELVETRMDIIPRYLHEYGAVSRPDVIVDSLWLVPTNPKAGEGLRFYARIKNISTTDSVRANILNQVKFQVDGATKATYSALEGLGPNGDTITVGYLPPNSTNGGGGWDRDWTANYGDHLIRAWVDSADRYVELNEANNMAYIQRHMAPSGKLIIPATGYNPGYVGGRKFSNVRPVKLSTEGNGSTIPMPDSVRIMNSWEGTWRPWRGYADSYWDTLSTGDEMKWVSAQWKMANGETTATVVDSIVLDMTPPVAYIATPTDSETVSETVTFWGSAHDSYAHFRVDTLRYFRSASQYGIIQVSSTPIGEMMMGELGAWNTYSVNDGWTHETLAVWDSAGNQALTQVTLYVDNADPEDGDGFAAGFGSFGSSPMNVATDQNGNLIVAETQGSKVRKYSPKKDSLFAFSARRANDSTGLTWAVGMAVKDSTTLWIADGYAHCIKRFDRVGNLLLRFGSFGQDTSQFRQPAGVALDPKGRLWVCDRLNHRVQVFDSTGKFLFKFGSQGSDSTQFNSPTGIAITPKGLVWVSDTRNNRVQAYQIDTASLAVKYLKTISRVDSIGLDTPLGICSDKRGNLYVADSRHHRIVKLNPYGQRLFVFGKEGDSLCQFKNPIGVASSPGAHFLYVADAGNRRVTRFTVIRGDTTGGGPQGGAGVQVLPMVYELGPAIPNPMNGATTIRYSLPKESVVSMKIYNVAGQMVREFNQGKQKAGYYSITWDGRSNLGHRVGAGVYFYRLEAGSWVKTRKLIVIR